MRQWGYVPYRICMTIVFCCREPLLHQLEVSRPWSRTLKGKVEEKEKRKEQAVIEKDVMEMSYGMQFIFLLFL